MQSCAALRRETVLESDSAILNFATEKYITSLVKGHGALSLGNVIGANLFNLVLVCGISTVISPFGVPSESTIGGMPASLVMDIPVMLGVMLLMTVPTLIRGKLSRVQGIILLCIYAAFCTVQFVL